MRDSRALAEQSRSSAARVDVHERMFERLQWRIEQLEALILGSMEQVPPDLIPLVEAVREGRRAGQRTIPPSDRAPRVIDG